MMKFARSCLALAIATGAIPLSAAVQGTITNGTTGKPQPGVAVILIQPGETGMTPIGQARSGPDGTFTIDKEPQGANPSLLQASFQGTSYTAMIAPNQPQTGIQIRVFDANPKRDAVSIDRHGILFEPVDDKLTVREFVFVENKGNTTYADSANGTYRFFVPGDPQDLNVEITAAGGMPLKRSASKAGPPNIYKIDFPFRPGQTQLDITYAYPKTDPLTFSGNVMHKEGETRLIVPKGFKLEGAGLEAFQPEPQTQSPIYGVKPGPFKVTITGQRIAPEPEEDPGQSEVKAARPRIYEKLYPILGISAAMLILGLWLVALNRSRKNAAAAPASANPAGPKAPKARK